MTEGARLAIRARSRLGRLVAGLAFTALLAPALPPVALAQDAEAEPLPGAGVSLEPGRYVSDAVGPTIDFRVGEGWRVAPEQLGGPAEGPIITLERTEQPGTVLSVTRFDGDTYLDSCDDTSLTRVEATVSRLAEIIGGNPYLNPGPPSVVEVDGHRGLQMDVATPMYTECPRPWLLIWALPIGDGGDFFVQVADQQSRFLILDVGGDVIVIAIESFPGVPFGGLLEASMELVGTMRIEPGEYIPPEPTSRPDATPTPGPSPSPSPSAPASSA